MSDKNTPALPTKSKKEPSSPKDTEKYYRVRFHEKQNHSDLNYIPLGVNGEVMQVTKGSEVVLPERFLEAARHAKIEQYKKGAKLNPISRAPYDLLGEATKEEFEEMRKEGTKKHIAELEAKSRAAERSEGVSN